MPSGPSLPGLLFAQNTLPAVELDARTGTIRRTSPAFATLSGATAEELCGRTFLELIPPGERGTVQAGLDDASGAPLRHSLIAHAGSLLAVRTSAVAVARSRQAPRSLLLLVEAEPAAPPPEHGNLFRQIVLSAHEGIWNIDTQLHTTFVNPRMCEMLGYTAAELHGRPVTDFLFPEEVAAQTKEMGLRRQGLATRYERRFRRKDGTALWTLVSGTPLLDQHQNYIGSFGLFTDITERKRAECALQLSEELYRSLLAATTDYVFTVHYVDGRPDSTTHGPDCVKITGYLPSDYAADPFLWYRMIAPEDRADVERHIQRTTAGDHAATIEHRLLHRDGSIRWVRNTLVPRRDPAGHLLALDGLVTDITERTRALQQLSERETLYHAIIETSPDGFWITDLQGRLLEVNDAYEQRSGYRRQELLAMNITDLEAQESPADTAAHIARILRDGSDLFETRHRTKDGTIWQVEINLSYWPIGDGRLFVFSRDLRHRKRSESLLRTRLALAGLAEHGSIEPLVRAALDTAELHTGSSSGFFHFVDTDQNNLTLQTWSTNTLRHRGTTEDQNRPHAVAQVGVWAECLRTHAPVIQNHNAERERENDLPPGHAPILRELTVPVLRHGRVAAIIGVGNKTTDYTAADVEAVQELASLAMDFVERLHAEQALRQSERQLRLIIDTVPALVAYIDPDYRCRLLNQTFALWFGEPLDTIPTRHLPDQVGPAAWSEIQPFVDRALAGENVVHESDLMLRGAGHRWLSICYSPDFDTAGLVRGIVILALDLTEHKQLEAQLLRSQRLEVVGRLAGGVAHDLNNILQPLLLAPGLLRPVIQDPDSIQLIDTIEQSVRRGAEIIKQLLAFGRGTQAQRRPLQLHAVVAEATRLLGGTFPKNITLRCELPAQARTVLADATQLQQVLMNLCVNARDALRQAGGTLTLRVESVTLAQPLPDSIPASAPGRYQVLTVADTGTGIAPEHLPKLFDPFFTTKDVGEGTGLGLPTVLGIVRSHDGFIHVSSTPRQGSRFRVYLPEALAPAAAPTPSEAEPACPGHGRLVLVVDDEAPVRDLIRQTLLRHNFQVHEAANGAEALALLHRKGAAPAIAIVDMLMPVMDGSRFIQKLSTRHPHVPIIAISGHLGPQRLAAAVRACIHTLLPKPFDSAQLLAALARLPLAAPPAGSTGGP